jgi:lipoprotein-anchoring transpeptidase ErfK/SrfK
MQAFDEQGRLLAHFPCSIAARVDKRVTGELRVTVLVPNPDYTFDPAIFADSPDARTLVTKLKIAPGPNNPVGTAWIGLDRPGYGIHGTPNPEQVGRTESHGCFRLANWNAERLLRLAWVGLPVVVEP